MLSIGAAALRLGTSPRMLRYRERLGLLPPVREAGAHRRYGPRELTAAAAGARLEARYDVGPAALAFAMRAVVEPALAAELRGLARLCGHLPDEPIEALAFEQRKALRLLTETTHPTRPMPAGASPGR